jgi:hypothetical protein
MDNLVLQLVFIVGIICFLAMIGFFLRKKTLSLKYTLLWLLSALVMLILSIFPDILFFVSGLLGFTLASNAVFALLLGFVIVILLSLTSIVSAQSENIKALVQANALLEKRLRELEDSNTKNLSPSP